MELINTIIAAGAKSAMTIEEIIKNEVSDWLNSDERKLMLEGQKYYKGDSEIINRERHSLGDNGRLERVNNLANNKLVHNFLKKLVDQKVGYLLSRPLSIQVDNKEYQEKLNYYFDKSTLRLLQNLGKESIVKGKSWIHVYYNEQGELSFKKMPSEEIRPLWKDIDHTELDAVIRVYTVEAYEGRIKRDIQKVEFWDNEGVKRYIYDGNLIPDVETPDISSHFSFVDAEGEENPVNWSRIPFICFKYNTEEIPLLKYIKSLIDDYDKQKSDNSNNLEDLPNSIYVAKGYPAQDAEVFRKNIALYRAVFPGEGGDVSTIDLKINTEAYKNHMEMNRKDIYEFGRGVDTQQKEIGNTSSGIALKFLYADLDMDANLIETEFQASLEQLLWFIDTHLANTIGEDYSSENVDFIFNRDILINETEAIENIKGSVGILSDETLIANHPFVVNVQEELERKEKQEQEALDMLGGYGSLGEGSSDE